MKVKGDKMVSIKNALGNNYENIILKDNENEFGGIAFEGETLKDFMTVTNIKPENDYGELCILLEKCGIKSIRPLNFIIKNSNMSNIKKRNKRIENMTYKELVEEDLEYINSIIKEYKNELYFDNEKICWCINDDEIVDLIWYDYNTIIHPKELIEYIEDYIENVLNIKK